MDGSELIRIFTMDFPQLLVHVTPDFSNPQHLDIPMLLGVLTLLTRVKPCANPVRSDG
jgi:hypothetical protein